MGAVRVHYPRKPQYRTMLCPCMGTESSLAPQGKHVWLNSLVRSVRNIINIIFETESYYIAQVCFELLILLLQTPKC